MTRICNPRQLEYSECLYLTLFSFRVPFSKILSQAFRTVHYFSWLQGKDKELPTDILFDGKRNQILSKQYCCVCHRRLHEATDGLKDHPGRSLAQRAPSGCWGNSEPSLKRQLSGKIPNFWLVIVKIVMNMISRHSQPHNSYHLSSWRGLLILSQLSLVHCFCSSTKSRTQEISRNLVTLWGEDWKLRVICIVTRII